MAPFAKIFSSYVYAGLKLIFNIFELLEDALFS